MNRGVPRRGRYFSNSPDDRHSRQQRGPWSPQNRSPPDFYGEPPSNFDYHAWPDDNEDQYKNKFTGIFNK